MIVSFVLFACRTTTKLGSGQFGCVDKGVWHSPEGPVDVAIKTLKPESPEEENRRQPSWANSKWLNSCRRQPSWANSTIPTLLNYMEWSLWENQ